MKRFLPRSEFGRSALTLMTGTTIAQAIPIAIAPILTRLYSPADYGVFAVYLSLSSILAVFSSGRYELAIMLPKDDADAANLVGLSIAISAIVSGLTLLVAFLFNTQIAELLGSPAIGPWLYFLPLSVLLTAAYQSLNFWSNRKKHYRRLAISRVAQTSASSTTQVAAGFAHVGTAGLVAGSLIGHGVSTAALAFQVLRDDRSAFAAINRSQSVALARKYHHHPLHLLPAHWIGTFCTQLPVLVLSRAFSAAVTGHFSLAQRMVSIPVTLVANAIGDVYRQRIAAAYNETGGFRPIFLRTLRKTTLIAVGPFVVLFLFAPELFAFFFGEKWRIAGEYARILSVASFFQFAFGPVDKGALVVGATRYILGWNVARLLALLGLGAVALLVEGIEVTTILKLYVAISSALSLVDLVVEYKLSAAR